MKNMSSGAVDLSISLTAFFVMEPPLSPTQVSTIPCRTRPAASRFRASQVMAPMVPE